MPQKQSISGFRHLKDSENSPRHRRLLEARRALERIKRGESPTAAELAAAPRLDFWCYTVDTSFPVLIGVVTGHPRLDDGAMITTSALLWLAEDRKAARTLSRFYRLGPALSEAPAIPKQ